MDPVQVTVHIGSQTLACPPPPDPPSLCACAITPIASSETSPTLFPCNKFILNTVATAKNPVATAKIIFFFILINLIISNCRPYYQHSVFFNAYLPCSSIGVKSHIINYSFLSNIFFISLIISLVAEDSTFIGLLRISSDKSLALLGWSLSIKSFADRYLSSSDEGIIRLLLR